MHHVRHWVDGGPTDLDNLVELCDQHHRCVHEMGWKISGDANVELTFQSPTGRRSASTPSRPLLQRETDRLVDRIVQRDVLGPAGHPDPDERRRRRRRGQGRLELRERRDLVTGRPNPRATAPMSLVGGVPKSCSNTAGSTDVACGRNEKIPPPPLSSTTNVHGTPAG